MADPLFESLASCESARQDLDDPLERLREVVADDDQYEFDSSIDECVEALTMIEDACDDLMSVCGRRLSSMKSTVGLVRRELTSLRKDLKSIGSSGLEGEDLQDRMEDWCDTFDEWDSALSDVVKTVRREGVS